jgi:molybdopterin converting factor small subunit
MATVNFYAAARTASGVSVAEIAGEKLGEVVGAATKLYPKLEAILAGCSYLVNGSATLNLETQIAPHDVIDILPRFAGGA